MCLCPAQSVRAERRNTLRMDMMFSPFRTTSNNIVGHTSPPARLHTIATVWFHRSHYTLAGYHIRYFAHPERLETEARWIPAAQCHGFLTGKSQNSTDTQLTPLSPRLHGKKCCWPVVLLVRSMASSDRKLWSRFGSCSAVGIILWFSGEYGRMHTFPNHATSKATTHILTHTQWPYPTQCENQRWCCCRGTSPCDVSFHR